MYPADFEAGYHEPYDPMRKKADFMDYRGKISGGVIVLEPGVELPEGAEVRVEVVAPATETSQTTLGQRLLKFAGRATGLPTDLADNHDHYLHGTPKR